MGKFNFEAEILPHLKPIARAAFAGRADQEDLVDDAASVAWEISETAGETATVGSICWYAVRRVRGGEHLARGRRSIGRRPAEDGVVRSDFDPDELSRRGDNPADIVGFRLDCQDWLATLPRLKRRAAEMLACGTSTGDAARELGVSPARVSQYRKELAANWELFCL